MGELSCRKTAYSRGKVIGWTCFCAKQEIQYVFFFAGGFAKCSKTLGIPETTAFFLDNSFKASTCLGGRARVGNIRQSLFLQNPNLRVGQFVLGFRVQISPNIEGISGTRQSPKTAKACCWLLVLFFFLKAAGCSPIFWWGFQVLEKHADVPGCQEHLV